MARNGRSKLESILQNEDIKRWYDNTARGAATTADVYARRLNAFCTQTGNNPIELAGKDESSLYQILLDYVTSEEKSGKAGSYIESSVKSVKSWLAFNNKKINGKIKIRGARKTPTLENERTPTQEELRRIFLVSTPRDRVACVLVAHSGLRLETLGNYKGTDGLRVKDFPEMVIENKKVTFSVTPTKVVVREELSKARHKYFTFLSDEGCEYLQQYLEMRLNDGEVITHETDIITPKSAEKKFVRTINIGDSIRSSFRTADFAGRPYVLRSFFDTQMLMAESKGKTTHAYRQFWMGHVGDIEAKYTTMKSKLPKHVVEDMRESYKRSQVFIQTIHTQDEDKETADFRRHILKVSGVSKEELDQLDVEGMDDNDVMEYLKKRLLKTIQENGNRQKVIHLDMVEDFIQNGWEYVANLPDDRAIMKLPNN